MLDNFSFGFHGISKPTSLHTILSRERNFKGDMAPNYKSLFFADNLLIADFDIWLYLCMQLHTYLVAIADFVVGKCVCVSKPLILQPPLTPPPHPHYLSSIPPPPFPPLSASTWFSPMYSNANATLPLTVDGGGGAEVRRVCPETEFYNFNIFLYSIKSDLLGYNGS